MPSPVANAQAAARPAQKSLAGVVVTLKRGEAESDEITAVVGQTRAEDIVSDTTTVQVLTRDYLIDVADYDLGDGPVKPQDGDEIREEDEAGTTRVYTVLPMGSERSSRFSDAAHTVYRIHTKLTANE